MSIEWEDEGARILSSAEVVDPVYGASSVLYSAVERAPMTALALSKAGAEVGEGLGIGVN